jgi:hypothetical protein
MRRKGRMMKRASHIRSHGVTVERSGRPRRRAVRIETDLAVADVCLRGCERVRGGYLRRREAGYRELGQEFRCRACRRPKRRNFKFRVSGVATMPQF